MESSFKGSIFYQIHANDIFLTEQVTVEGILCQGKKIRAQLKTLQPGQTLTIGNALMTVNTPLVIKKGGQGVTIKDDEYTLNRLTGMCAAYAAQQGSAFSPKCAMGVSLGLDVSRDRILYYSAAPGAEHFTEIFTYQPLLCAIKQLEAGKVSKDNIAKIAAVKSDNGKTLSTLMVEAKAALPSKLGKFGTGGSRGTLELEKALNAIRNLSGINLASTSR